MTDRLQEIRARLESLRRDGNAGDVGDYFDYYDIAWLLGEVDRLSFQEKNMKRIQKDLQDRHQILASERNKNYSMDVRMVNDGREF